MATMKEVADRAGVSVATVSRVINHSGYVRLELQEKVETAMREMRYRPSALARSLRRQETLTVGLLLPQLDQPFFSRLAYTVVQALFTQNYHTLVCSSEEDQLHEDISVDMLIRQRVDGVIATPIGSTGQAIRALLDQNVPVVILDRDLPHFEVNKVFSDHRQGGRLAAQHLLENGHRDILIISPPDDAASVVERIAGAMEVFAAHGVQPEILRAGLDERGDYYMRGYAFAKQIFESGRRPTAVFALMDVMAVGVLRAAAELGLRVPQDLSVIGFDDIPLARQSVPALTTIRQPTDNMAKVAVETLMAVLADRDRPPQTHILPTQLIVRESTGRRG
jgi:LacI family transcriptional regulator